MLGRCLTYPFTTFLIFYKLSRINVCLARGHGKSKANGKIERVGLLIFHVILMKILQYLLDQILKMRRPLILDVLVNRHSNLVNKIVSIVLSSPYSASTYNFWYIISVVLLICTTMCSNARTNAKCVRWTCYRGYNRYVNKDVNICCAAGAISWCICWFWVNLTPNTKIHRNIKISNMVFVCIIVCLFILYCASLSSFLSIYCSTICIVIVFIIYHNVLITSTL